MNTCSVLALGTLVVSLLTPVGVWADPAPAPTIDLSRWPDRRPDIVLPPAWAFGVLYGGYTDQSGSLEKIDRLIDAGFPINAYWIDSWFWDFENRGKGPSGYLDFEGDRARYPDPAALWGAMEERSI